MIKFDSAIECLETLGDELAGAGDYINADMVSEIIQLLEDEKQIHIPKVVEDEGDNIRCPKCFHIVYGLKGRCWECGQRYTR